MQRTQQRMFALTENRKFSTQRRDMIGCATWSNPRGVFLSVEFLSGLFPVPRSRLGGWDTPRLILSV